MLTKGKPPAAQKQAAKVAFSETTTVYEFGERYYKEIVCRDLKEPGGVHRYIEKDIYPRFGQRAMKK